MLVYVGSKHVHGMSEVLCVFGGSDANELMHECTEYVAEGTCGHNPPYTLRVGGHDFPPKS